MTTPDAPIDLRSDTVTRPTEGMLAAMIEAPLGDDVFGDDPTVLALQAEVASLLGKETALYVPSGTMANQLALRAHTRAGDDVIAHARSHIVNYESGAPAGLAGVNMRVVDSDDGSLPLGDVAANIHQTDDPHFAPTTLICVENTHNGCGGKIVPHSHTREVCTLASERSLGTHLDGARLFHAAVATSASLAELSAPFDTVSICLSKGLGAPIGSVLAGPRDLMARAYRFRKMYGGGMRQAGIVAAAGRYALQHHVSRLRDDHRRARVLAEGIDSAPGLSVDLGGVHTNLVYFDLDPAHPLATADVAGGPGLVRRLSELGVLITGGVHRLRAVTHLDVDDGQIDRSLEIFRRVMA